MLEAASDVNPLQPRYVGEVQGRHEADVHLARCRRERVQHGSELGRMGVEVEMGCGEMKITKRH